MAIKTVAGPFNTRIEAESTAKYLGNQFSVYGKHLTDKDGYTLDDCVYYVERDDSITPDNIFGYGINEFLAKQYK